ncbi:MAG: HAD hydrolase family protein [Acidaminococcaceae bacterium]|jgi:3-deoxy-D-manno-octulosonate 8-phosphate phosphatase (KDO 8-P phosphatase)|nr:HAD hydrolase family protein [Acidaminococcaceae bacterium]MCI2110032.1 HAD hydrolase family protein [Acidaminococcaceae bacterium]
MPKKLNFSNIKLLAVDVDGVLTDGSIIIGQDGELSKHFSVLDGLGIRVAIRKGLQFSIITGRHSEILLHRAMELNISSVYENVVDKGETLVQIAKEAGIDMDDVAFMGDDLNDLSALDIAGASFAPVNAVDDVKKIVDYVTVKPGGAGAVREVVEKILTDKGIWQDVVASYIKRGQGDQQ